jgi:hypothetical protein
MNYEGKIIEYDDFFEILVDQMYFGEFIKNFFEKIGAKTVSIDLSKGKLSYSRVNKFSDEFLNGFFHDIEKVVFNENKAQVRTKNIELMIKKLIRNFGVLDMLLFSSNVDMGINHDKTIMIKFEKKNKDKIKKILKSFIS